MRAIGVEELQRFPVLAAANAQALEAFAQECHVRSFEVGQLVLAKDDASNDVMLLLSGQVRVTLYSEAGREIAIKEITEGHIFGDYAAIDGAARSASVVAITPLQVARVKAAAFMTLLEQCPAAAKAQMQTLVAMIRELAERVYELSALKASTRLHHYLVKLAQPVGENRAEISPKPTHADISAFISAQRPVVTQELVRLANNGIITQEKDRLLINDFKTLSMLAEVG